MAQADGHDLLLGKMQLLMEQRVTIPDGLEDRARTLADFGRSVIVFAIDGEIAGLLVLEDVLRPEAKSAIDRLHQIGLSTILVSGDNRSTVERIASDLGIQEVHAEVLPREKAQTVRDLQSRGHKVAFVGDGVNDGPALATADVGVAMGLAGTHVAIETAEIALLSDELSKLPQLVDLSRRAIRVIRQNLVFSLSVLAAAIALTVPGILSPVTGALLHELSSIPVIANSARLIGVGERN